jgi:uncharacterized protein (TIGR03083 family)
MAEHPAPTLDEVTAALTLSHERLVAAVEPLSDDEVAGPSYHDWSIAQVLSHLGSGAEIFTLMVDAGARGKPAPGIDDFHPVWDRWNAMSPPEQVRNAVETDAAFLRRLGELSLPERDAWRLDFFGGEKTLAEAVRMRLAEHAMHTWDVVVVREPEATVSADAVTLLIDYVAGMGGRAGKPAHVSRVRVTTERPERSYLIDAAGDAVTITADPSDDEKADGSLRLPAEALLRLVYGRLDPDHTPGTVVAEGVHLDALRRTFPGL